MGKTHQCFCSNKNHNLYQTDRHYCGTCMSIKDFFVTRLIFCYCFILIKYILFEDIEIDHINNRVLFCSNNFFFVTNSYPKANNYFINVVDSFN